MSNEKNRSTLTGSCNVFERHSPVIFRFFAGLVKDNFLNLGEVLFRCFAKFCALFLHSWFSL